MYACRLSFCTTGRIPYAISSDMREWVDRIGINEKSLKNSDIKLILNFLVEIKDDFLNEKDILVKKF